VTLQLPLTYLHRPADPADNAPWLLILLHGVGSNETDLFGLAPDVPDGFHVVSLRAPNRMGPNAFGWFTFVVHPDGHRAINAEQEESSRRLVAKATSSAAKQLSVPARRVVVGGFSQGGIMSLSLLLTQPYLVTAALVMHSRLLPEVTPLIAPVEALRGRLLWVSHGTMDPVIPVASAHDIRERIRGLPVQLTYAEFPGGHEIRPAELSAAMSWLNSITVGNRTDGH
jgi:phospholipase/carboxylesterase